MRVRRLGDVDRGASERWLLGGEVEQPCAQRRAAEEIVAEVGQDDRFAIGVGAAQEAAGAGRALPAVHRSRTLREGTAAQPDSSAAILAARTAP